MKSLFFKVESSFKVQKSLWAYGSEVDNKKRMNWLYTINLQISLVVANKPHRDYIG